MVDLSAIGSEIGSKRRARHVTQAQLAQLAGVSRATVEALENGRTGELGYTKVVKLLAVLGLDLRLVEAERHRPTLEDLREEERRDQSLDRRR